MSSHTKAETDITDLRVVSFVFSVLPTVVVGARFITKRLKAVSFAGDDWAVLLALSFHWVLFSLIIDVYQHGGHGHLEEATTPASLGRLRQNLYIFNIVYVVTLPCIKISIILLQKRIFDCEPFRRAAYSILGFMALWVLAALAFGILYLVKHCESAPNQLSTRFCSTFAAYSITYVTINITTDAAVFVMPMPWLWRLHAPRSQKVAWTLVFAVGILAFATSLTRAVLAIPVSNDKDLPKAICRVYLWTMVEIGTAIACSCVSTLRPLLPGSIARRRSQHHSRGYTDQPSRWPSQAKTAMLESPTSRLGFDIAANDSQLDVAKRMTNITMTSECSMASESTSTGTPRTQHTEQDV